MSVCGPCPLVSTLIKKTILIEVKLSFMDNEPTDKSKTLIILGFIQIRWAKSGGSG